MDFGHHRTKLLQFPECQILFTEKYTNNVDDDGSNLFLTDESKVFQKLADVGFHDILYRDVQRVVNDSFDIAFGNNIEKGEEPASTRP